MTSTGAITSTPTRR